MPPSSWAATLPICLALGACSPALVGLGASPSSTPPPATIELLREMPRVQNSPRAPCWLQEQIAAQNSYVDAITKGRRVVYVAPCKGQAEPIPPAVPGKQQTPGTT